MKVSSLSLSNLEPTGSLKRNNAYNKVNINVMGKIKDRTGVPV